MFMFHRICNGFGEVCMWISFSQRTGEVNYVLHICRSCLRNGQI